MKDHASETPDHASTGATDEARCPVCGYGLHGSIAAGKHVCPECGWQFTENDLQLLGPSDQRGQPRSLNPKERRLRGPWLLVLLALAILLTMSIVWLIISASPFAP